MDVMQASCKPSRLSVNFPSSFFTDMFVLYIYVCLFYCSLIIIIIIIIMVIFKCYFSGELVALS